MQFKQFLLFFIFLFKLTTTWENYFKPHLVATHSTTVWTPVNRTEVVNKKVFIKINLFDFILTKFWLFVANIKQIKIDIYMVIDLSIFFSFSTNFYICFVPQNIWIMNHFQSLNRWMQIRLMKKRRRREKFNKKQNKVKDIKCGGCVH